VVERRGAAHDRVILGIEIEQQCFSQDDYTRFKERLHANLKAFEQVLARPGFGHGEPTIGAELELFLIDPDGRPLAISDEVIATIDNPIVTPEMGAFDIELSTAPVSLRGRPFSRLRDEIEATLAQIRRGAAQRGARVVPISILPTFRRGDFHPGAITDRPRYRALAEGLKKLRAAPFVVAIDGDDPLELETDNAAMEAANTAFQLHLRVEPEAFARHFNAAMMLTAPVLAAAANSPTFLGHRLWHETRVALFKQAGDDRPPRASADDWRKPARIGFGTGWVREGALELFAESVALHEPLLPVCSDEDLGDCTNGGAVPELSELRLHHGTVWNWNRPVYDPAGEGHLRIELRALPAGPSLDDMLANAAFLLGAILAFAPEVGDLLPAFPFEAAERNFHRAAQFGLDAELVWPMNPGAPPERIAVRELIEQLLPRAREGLVGAGVADAEADRFIDIMAQRVACGVSGAAWQRQTLEALQAGGMPRDRALGELLERYLRGVESGLPVHRWAQP
jgi:gamma-glutamyl:cysteine ligase YbdK (ATP-grasp superfamily)